MSMSLIISAAMSFIIAAGGVVLSHGEDPEISKMAIIIAVVTGAIAFAKDIQSQMKTPPM